MKHLNTNNEQSKNELMERVVNKWWYKFCYGYFTGEQLEMFYNDIDYAGLDLNTVLTEMLYKKKDVYNRRFEKLSK